MSFPAKFVGFFIIIHAAHMFYAGQREEKAILR